MLRGLGAVPTVGLKGNALVGGEGVNPPWSWRLFCTIRRILTKTGKKQLIYATKHWSGSC